MRFLTTPDGWTRERVGRDMHFTYPGVPYPVKSVQFLGIIFNEHRFKSLADAKAAAVAMLAAGAWATVERPKQKRAVIDEFAI